MDEKTNRTLADALADVRAEITRLKAREKALRAEILQQRPKPSAAAKVKTSLEGDDFVAEVTYRTTRRFDKDLLPEEIRNIPKYWKEVTTATVITKKLTDASPRPSRRTVAACPMVPPARKAARSAYVDDLIEPF